MGQGKQSKVEKRAYKRFIKGDMMLQRNKHLNVRKLNERINSNESNAHKKLVKKIDEYHEIMGLNLECTKHQRYPFNIK